MEPQALQAAREKMVASQIIGRGIKDKRVLAAFRAVPRHLFVPPEMRGSAYEDRPLPIGEGQTISQPYIVALMTRSLGLTGVEKVLEIGTGSGYQAAILSRLAREVHTVERIEALSAAASKTLALIGCDNVRAYVGDGTEGLAGEAPFDAIVVTAASPSVPEPLTAQLAEGGVMVIPVGGRNTQDLDVIVKKAGRLDRRTKCQCVFVPLIGRHAY